MTPNQKVERSRAVPEGRAPLEESKWVGLVAGRLSVVIAGILGVMLIV